MWNIFIGIILGCLGVLAIDIILFILTVIIDTGIKQVRGDKNGINGNK